MKLEEHLLINRKNIEKILDSVGYKYEVLPSMYNVTLHVFKDSKTN